MTNHSASSSSESKKAALAGLERDLRQAMGGGKRLVFGEGDVDSRLAIVGEAPGRQEEMTGRPFVGPAGHLLDGLLQEVGLRRGDIWMTNLVKWRPTGPASRTRGPRAGEIKSSAVWLRRELEIIRPDIILCLGNQAARAVVDKSFKMNEQRGQWHKSFTSAAAIATFHPAYVLRQGRSKRDQVLNLIRADLQKAERKYTQSLQKDLRRAAEPVQK